MVGVEIPARSVKGRRSWKKPFFVDGAETSIAFTAFSSWSLTDELLVVLLLRTPRVAVLSVDSAEGVIWL